jgi:hypothetical protein
MVVFVNINASKGEVLKSKRKELNSDCILSRSFNRNHERCTALEIYKLARLTIHCPHQKNPQPAMKGRQSECKNRSLPTKCDRNR